MKEKPQKEQIRLSIKAMEVMEERENQIQINRKRTLVKNSIINLAGDIITFQVEFIQGNLTGEITTVLTAYHLGVQILKETHVTVPAIEWISAFETDAINRVHAENRESPVYQLRADIINKLHYFPENAKDQIN